jgi:hypothetical protein
MVCICTFLAYQQEMWPKYCPFWIFLKQAMSPSGTNGFRNINLKDNFTRNKIDEFIVDKI